VPVVGVNERLEHADILLSNYLQKEKFVGSMELKDALPNNSAPPPWQATTLAARSSRSLLNS
jgi:hypothetical protein